MIINFSTVFKALDTFVAQHNTASESLSTRLRQPVVATVGMVLMRVMSYF